jgi:hypothetical protein
MVIQKRMARGLLMAVRMRGFTDSGVSLCQKKTPEGYQQYFQKNLKVGAIWEKILLEAEVEIEMAIFDIVLIDKRTGRIRSILVALRFGNMGGILTAGLGN